MRLATEPTSVKLPASVAAIATTSHARCGSCKFGTNDLSKSAAGTLLTTLDSTAVTPARIAGLSRCWRPICFAFLTPFYFLKAGSLIEAKALIAGAGLIAVFLAMKMVTKFVGILPLTRYFKFDKREGMYTTLMMSTGLTFGSISALFGLTNHIIDQEQYTILLTAVIGSAVVPTLIAQIWFQPHFEPLEEDA